MDKKRTIRILLINPHSKILLMRGVDPTTHPIDQEPHPAFWCTLGGKIESGESVEQAAKRELFEETSLSTTDVSFGPIIWYGLHEMMIYGKHVELDERFIVAHLTSNKQPSQENFTESERSVVTHLEWFSLDEILQHKEPIYPAILKTHLKDILAGIYPQEPEWVDLALQP